ncbi:hypothetical protein ABOM_010073 [Aspergillus bombycis]|uniref:AB hydrolase-1 domain-containing protein n=1 Tax=Aspergillus bombycis TaxID=109264 RepID=A0A1F7ZPT0_9EURO|nr:hypothetical protein ABOM_010073 [Aspergillus bombycis]OGM41470.1 hypothetical protein ABOM_010073 [Aspergillus bombycis]
MTTSQFQVKEHTIPCQSIREYHHAVKGVDPPLQLAVKQYIPLNNLNPSPDDITIIAGHANGIPKECYEPIWDDLLRLTRVKIKAIWMADCSHQGASGVLNEQILGDDPNWFDHSRDLLLMVNHFRDQIQPPISCLPGTHDPSGKSQPARGPSPARWTSTRPDEWPSQQDAETHIRRNPFWRRWDPRAVNAYIQFGLRPVPTSSSGAVTLTTTKAQEAWTYLRFNPTPHVGSDLTERFLNPDLAVTAKEGDNHNPNYVTVCPWSCIAFEFLPYVRPSVLFVFGEKSHINLPARRRDKLERMGVGLGGSGGLAAGRVHAEVLPGSSHMAPLEKVQDTARLISLWLEAQLELYLKEREFWGCQYNSGKSEQDGRVLSAQWMKYDHPPPPPSRHNQPPNPHKNPNLPHPRIQPGPQHPTPPPAPPTRLPRDRLLLAQSHPPTSGRRLPRRAPDQRGFGRTTGWGTRPFSEVDLHTFTLTSFVRDMVTLVHALGYRSVQCVVGHDCGAVTAAMCALVRPDFFKSVVLLSHPFNGSPVLPFGTAGGSSSGEVEEKGAGGTESAAGGPRAWRACGARPEAL